jgi:ribosomal protein L16 Arg81 hydroxylase
MMLIGDEGAGMFNHQDVLRTASWQVQLQGSKLWHICAPDQSFALYEAGDVDVWQPNYERFPRFAQADCYEVTVQPGEFIYYPADYWHQTRKYECN